MLALCTDINKAVAESAVRVASCSVWGLLAQRYQITKFVVSSFGMDSVLLAEDSNVDSS